MDAARSATNTDRARTKPRNPWARPHLVEFKIVFFQPRPI